MGNNRLRNKLCSKYILAGVLAVVALLGSAIGAIAFDYDHLLAWAPGIEDGRFLHHQSAFGCSVLMGFLSWGIIKLVGRLSNQIRKGE